MALARHPAPNVMALAKQGCEHPALSSETVGPDIVTTCYICDLSVAHVPARDEPQPLARHVESEEWCIYCRQPQPCGVILGVLKEHL